MANEPAVSSTAITEADVARRLDEALTAHNARTESIMSCEEAKGREDLAKFLAFSTKLDVDAVRSALAKAPKPAQAAANPFERAMASTANPQVGADGDPAASEYKPGTMAAKMRRQLNLPAN